MGMSIDEAIQIATQNNDSKMMLSIGQFYWDNQQFDEAQDWYFKSALLGNPLAAILAKNAFKIHIITCKKLAFTDEIIKAANSIIKCIEIVSNDSQFIEENGLNSEIIEDKNFAYYELGEAFFWEKNYTQAISCLKCVENNSKQYVKTQITLGLTYSNIASDIIETTNNIDAKVCEFIQTSVHCWKELIPTGTYIPKPKNEDHTAQLLFAYAGQKYANYYTFGIGINKDENLAYNILISVLNRLTDEECKNHINAELSKYKKNLFGGYKYIG